MLTCYLDDSGKDSQNPITTIAGYAAKDCDWAKFEEAVEPWFEEYNVKILHAMDLHKTKGEFKGWSVLRKQAFISRVCLARNPNVMIGMSMSAMKDTYKIRADSSGRKRTVTPYTFSFNVIIDWILRGIITGKAAHEEGVALILECGHENNSEAEQQFYEVRRIHKVEHILKSISFVPKESCRAIQLADLLAFYSRRSGVSLLKATKKGLKTYPIDTMDRIIVDGLPHRAMVATDFGQSRISSRFFDFSGYGESS